MDIFDLLAELDELDEETKGYLKWSKSNILYSFKKNPRRYRNDVELVLNEYEQYVTTVLTEKIAKIKKLITERKVFLEGSKKNRGDSLKPVLEEIVKKYYQEHGKLPVFSEMTKRLKSIANSHHNIIQEVKHSKVYWVNERTGKESKTSFDQLRKRLTPIRKPYLSTTK